MAISFTTNQDKSNWFGSDVPFAEPAWYQGMDSPYYTDSHRAFRAKVRKFVDEWRPKVEDLDEQAMKGKQMPMEIFRAAYEAGVYSPMIPAEFGGTPPEGGFDAFHDIIWLDEMSRLNCGGFGVGFTIWTMALPPIMIWGSDYLKNLLVRDVVTAKTFMALAISEPSAGSDVANIQTTAKREGDHYVINGQKKWISFAKYSDYFTVACRTGGDGMGGISLIVVPRNTPGVTVRPMPLQSLWSAGTSYVTFEDVKVPVKNLIGNKENQGFKMIMFNFNHERFSICVGACRAARECLAESIKYARVRTVFGKRLIDSQVIRHKIAEMATRVQALHAMIEHLAYQMKNNVHPIAIGGPMALLKVQASKTFEYCAREASQIFGGASYVREGKGALIERLYREVRSTAIPGGSEEIMLDLAMRMAKL